MNRPFLTSATWRLLLVGGVSGLGGAAWQRRFAKRQCPRATRRRGGGPGTGCYYDFTGQLVHEFTKPPRPGSPSARWQEPEAPHAVKNTGEEADRFVRVELNQ